MSLYFNERIDEKKKEEDPLKDVITFTDNRVLTSLTSDEIATNSISGACFKFQTKYMFHTATWYLYVQRNSLNIANYEGFISGTPDQFQNSSCIISYNLYSDNDMKVLTYSSPRIKMLRLQYLNSFYIPDKKCGEAYVIEGKAAKIVIFIELRLSAKYFFRPFDKPSCILSNIFYDEYPKNTENDFRFDFLEESDYLIKCPDGTMPAMRMVLNNASKFMYEHFEKSEDNELVVEHLIDVIKPVVIFLHTFCFEMPKSYDLDFVNRLLKAINFFQTEQENFLRLYIQKALCQKFVKEKLTFDSILQWLTIACQYYFRELKEMIATVIVDKFYFEWHQTFPPNARNNENPLFRHVFGLGHLDDFPWMFRKIERSMIDSLATNVILD